MATVKNLAFVPKEKLKDLTSFDDVEHPSFVFTPFPFNIIHCMLPLKLKFLKETYAASDNGKIYGLITLEKHDLGPKKLKISQLFLKENSVKYGELLVNYVVNKYLAQGAESFFAVLDEMDDKMLKLLTEVCKFRILGDEYLFRIKKSDFSYEKNSSYDFIRFAKAQEAPAIADLYNGLINSHQYPSFAVSEKCFKDNIFVGIKNRVLFRYVLENTETGKIFGYFSISTANNSDYILNAAILQSYEAYLADILKFARHEISKRSPSWALYVKIKNCFSNYRALLDVMKSYDFTPCKKSKILTRDLYRTIKADNPLYDKQIIFNAPAY